MPNVTAKFSVLDKMSEAIASISEAGARMVEQFERAGDTSSATFDGISTGAVSTATAVDGVASSIDSLQGAADSAVSSADALSDSLNEYGEAVNDAVSQTDYWTEAVGSYDRSALEAIYSTEELVRMGLKSAEALEAQEQAMSACEKASSELSKAAEKSATTQNKLSTAIDKADKVITELADNENVSAETKEELSRAAEKAQEAIDALARANEEADAAQEAYNQTVASGADDIAQLEAAAERAASATEALAKANNTANEATADLTNATDKASKEAKQNGIDAIQGIATAVAAAGITAMVEEIAEAVYSLADSFSEAEKTIVASTGATGEELDKLMESSLNIFASSSAESLNDVAIGMTAVKNATGLAGDELEEATSYALAFENALGYEVAESSRTASALMKNFGLTAEEAYGLIAAGAQQGANKNGDLMDILNEYSAQYAALGLSAEEFMTSLIDGADAGVFSIDKIGDAVKEFNIRAKDGSDTSAEAFELLGMNAEVMTAKFAAGGETARTAFFEVVTALDSMSDPMDKNTAAVGLFGTMYEDLEAGLLPILAGIEGGTLDMGGALETVTKDAQSLSDKWQQAGNSIQTAFTSAVEPAITGISGGLAGVAQGFGTFLNEHPVVAKAITVIGVGLGVVAVALAGVSAAIGIYTAVTTIAEAVTAAFGVTFAAAFLPITLIVAGIAALATGIYFLVDALQEDMGATEGMTAATRAQYYELQDLNAEYEEACEKYGENSEEALRLKYQVDDLSAAFEANRQTVEEFTAEVDELCESVHSITEEFNNSLTEINAQETGTLALIQKYEDLATQSEITEAQQKELEAITKKLTDTYPDLAAELDNTTLSAEDYVAAMEKACEQEAERQRHQQMQDTYTEALEKQGQLAAEIAKAEENIRLEQERMDDMSGWEHFWTGGEWDDLEAYQAALDELNAAMAENDATIAQIKQEWADIAEAEAAAAEETISWENAAETAYENVKDRVIELCEAYGEAYNAALESFEGQFGLFDEASMKSEEYLESTVSNAQEAMNSQLAYWEEYNANLEALTAYGDTLTGEAKENYDALIAYAQDGSEQAAGLADSIAAAIESGDEAAITELANTVAAVSEQQEAAAATTAEWKTNFSAEMDEIEKEMQATVEAMNLDTEAQESATATIQSYADAIRAGKANAVSAAEEVANAVSAAFSSAKTSVSVNVSSATSVPGHANGTTNAESVFLAGENGPELVARKAATYATGTTDSTDYFIAGENGPELIVGEQGSTVFPTGETDRLIDALNTDRQPLQVFAGAGTTDSDDSKKSASEQVKKILLEIAGSGAIEVGGGADKETILEVLYEHLKPVLMNIIQSEIYEEGELSYEF